MASSPKADRHCTGPQDRPRGQRAAFSAGFLLAACAALAPAADDWPRWRGPSGDGSWDPAHLPADFLSHEPERLWTVPVAGGYGGVTVGAGKVYLMDRPKGAEVERLLCLDSETGRGLWRHEWSANYGEMDYPNGPRASVTIHEGRAYTLGATGMALCLKADTGALLWQVDTVRDLGAKMPQWGFAASPVIDGPRVLLHVGAAGGGSVVALSRADGTVMWKGGPDPAGYCTPEIIRHNGGRQVIAWGPEHVQSLGPESGAVNWLYPYKITYGVSIAQPLYRDGVLLVSGYWHGTKALRLGPDRGEVALLWENEKDMCGLMSAPLFKDGFVYLLDKTVGLQCVELNTGKIRWSDGNTLTPKDRNPQIGLLWLRQSENLAALLNASGEWLYARLTPNGREELARYQVIGKTWAHPAVAGNRLYARSDTELIAWRLWPDQQ